jgi:transmembrane sensor
MTGPTARQQAARWLTELDTSERIEALWPEFETWLNASPEHREAYHRAELARCELEILRDEVMSVEEVTQESVLAAVSRLPVASARRRALWIGIPVTAGFVLTLLAVFVVMPAYTKQRAWAHYRTELGQLKHIVLEDGSVVDLDTNTHLRARLSWTHRDLVLEKGQAAFDVRSEWLRPFDVEVNDDIVHATGTQFAVDRRDADTFDTFVQKGAVDIIRLDSAGGTQTEEGVSAGHTATITPGGVHVESDKPSDAARHLAWVDGILDFNDTLEYAVNEFNRYNTRRLVIADHALDERLVTGRYRATDPDAFADALVGSHGISHVSIGTRGSREGEIRLGAH